MNSARHESGTMFDKGPSHFTPNVNTPVATGKGKCFEKKNSFSVKIKEALSLLKKNLTQLVNFCKMSVLYSFPFFEFTEKH